MKVDDAVVRWEQADAALVVERADGSVLRVEAISEGIARLQLAMGGRFERSPGLEHGLIKHPTQQVTPSLQVSETQLKFGVGRWRCVLDRQTGRIDWQDAQGRGMCREAEPGWQSSKPGAGAVVRLELQAGEHFYGLGFQRTALDLRGQKFNWARRFRSKEASVPFYWSTNGYGLFSGNPRDQVFDFTQINEMGKGQVSVSMSAGGMDIYLLAGPTPGGVLREFTELTGRPQLPPRFALGLLYIARYYETQQGLLGIARKFRERDIPIDMLGLEPGWEEEPYSMKWAWSRERYPDPADMIGQLREMGYTLELWESGKAPEEGYLNEAVREKWYAQRVAAALDVGVRWFKQDDPYPRMIQSQEMQAPVLMQHEQGQQVEEDEEKVCRNLANSLFSRTVIEGYEQRTGQRGMVLFNSYWASVGSQRWPTAWAADFAAGCGLLSACLSGHAMVSLDMEVHTQRGVHYAYLTPFVLNDSWAYYDEPWLYPPYLEEAHRFYAKLRQRLVPYLYTLLREAYETGKPMMRAMVMNDPEDTQVHNLTTQHMLGDWLLVGQASRVYLPMGRWVDAWTGKVYASQGEWVEVRAEEPTGGPMLVKEGAMLPTRCNSPWLAAEAEELITWELYPQAEGESVFALYEDDGDTPAYQRGEWVRTSCDMVSEAGRVTVHIGAREGWYEGMSKGRVHVLKVHRSAQPREVRLGDDRLGEVVLPRVRDRSALLREGDGAGWWHDASSGITWVKAIGGWRLGPDERGMAGDRECDSVKWAGEAVNAGRVTVTLVDQENQGKREAGHDVGGLVEMGAWQTVSDRPADGLRVLANPPERIALKDGRWLPMKADIHVWLTAEGKLTQTPPTGSHEKSGAQVVLEVCDEQGQVMERLCQVWQKGRAVFEGLKYEPGVTRFVARCCDLPAVETMVRPSPAVRY